MRTGPTTGCYLLALSAMLATTMAAQDRTSEQKRVVHMVAERFSFSPSEITVEPGTTVELHLTSDDTAHGFKIAGPNGVDVVIPKRRRGEVVATFAATEPGDYIFECSRMCGAGHSFMRGRIRVKVSK